MWYFHVRFILGKTHTIGDSMTQYACRTLEQEANFRRCVILGNCEDVITSFLIYLGGGMSVLCQFPFRAGGRGRGAGAVGRAGHIAQPGPWARQYYNFW